MTNKKFEVLVVGELNVDLILDQIERLPQIGKEIIADKMTFTLGSSSAIFASNLSVLGTSVCFCGKIGKDSFANKILADLTLKGVDVNFIQRSNTAATGISVAFNFNNDRAMITYPGAMNELSENDVTDEMLSSATHLHVSSIFLQSELKKGLVQLFQRAKKHGLTTSLDPQWDPAEKWDCNWKDLLKYVDIFLPNFEELKNITNQSTMKDAIASIKEYCTVLVVKNGADGATIVTPNNLFLQPAFTNHKVADAIGAGDSFDAGFIHQYLKDETVHRCAEFAALCGAINTTKRGGTTAFADIDTVKRIALQKFKFDINEYEKQISKLY